MRLSSAWKNSVSRLKLRRMHWRFKMQDKELQEALQALTVDLAALVGQMALDQPLDQVVAEYLASVTMLADEATEWSLQYYEELLPESNFVPEPFVDPTFEPRLSASARYAVSEEKTATVLEGSGTRAIMDQSRSTLIHNAKREHGNWYRVASPDACGFCRLLATRGPVYHSAHAAAASHDRCKCRVAVERPGMTHKPPAYAHGWNRDYENLRAQVIRDKQKPTLDNIVNAWNRQIRADLKAAGAAADHLEDVA
jgi:hypothetical protein